jgi:hypothetical protein
MVARGLEPVSRPTTVIRTRRQSQPRSSQYNSRNAYSPGGRPNSFPGNKVALRVSALATSGSLE